MMRGRAPCVDIAPDKPARGGKAITQAQGTPFRTILEPLASPSRPYMNGCRNRSVIHASVHRRIKAIGRNTSEVNINAVHPRRSQPTGTVFAAQIIAPLRGQVLPRSPSPAAFDLAQEPRARCWGTNDVHDIRWWPMSGSRAIAGAFANRWPAATMLVSLDLSRAGRCPVACHLSHEIWQGLMF